LKNDLVALTRRVTGPLAEIRASRGRRLPSGLQWDWRDSATGRSPGQEGWQKPAPETG